MTIPSGALVGGVISLALYLAGWLALEGLRLLYLSIGWWLASVPSYATVALAGALAGALYALLLQREGRER